MGKIIILNLATGYIWRVMKYEYAVDLYLKERIRILHVMPLSLGGIAGIIPTTNKGKEP